jgi:hypothetical protein
MATASGVRFSTVCFAGGATKLMNSSAVAPGQGSSSGGALASGSGKQALRRTLSGTHTKWREAHGSQESVANPQGTTLHRSEPAREQKRGEAATVGASTSSVLSKRLGAIPALRTSGHHTVDSRQ